MTEQHNKNLLILISIIIGVSVVFLALIKSGILGEKEKSGGPSFFNNNWMESLTVVGENSTTTTALSSDTPNSILEPDATTTTGKLAQTTFLNTMMYQASNEDVVISDEDSQALVEKIVDQVVDKNPAKLYSETDVAIVETTEETYGVYKSEFAEAFRVFSATNPGNELDVISKTLTSKDVRDLKPLEVVVPSYKNLIQSLLTMKVPHVMKEVHVTLLQGYAFMFSGVQDMQQTITDPTQAMIGINKYNTGIQLIMIARDAINNNK